MAKIELSKSWAGVAEPLRALMAEVEREAHTDGSAPDLAAVSARWAQVSDAIRATVRARIADAQAVQAPAPRRDIGDDQPRFDDDVISSGGGDRRRRFGRSARARRGLDPVYVPQRRVR